MNCYKVNLDYEEYLFNSNYKENSPANISLIKEFEYIFFLVNKKQCKLKNYAQYSKNYIEKLTELGMVIPEFTPNADDATSWWGPCLDRNLEIILNSKITSAQIALKNNWGMFEGTIVSSPVEARSWMNQYSHISQWLLKNPFGMSGRGHIQYTGQDFKGPCLLEPLRERVFDIGTTFTQEKGLKTGMFMVENHNVKQGSFKGGMALANQDQFKNYIMKKYQFDLSNLEIITQSIFELYRDMGASSNLQIDSFVYKDPKSGEYILYPLVEVNYRKTMGLVMQSLVDHFKCSQIEWRITHTKDLENNNEWIKLSPDNNRFNSYVRTI